VQNKESNNAKSVPKVGGKWKRGKAEKRNRGDGKTF